MANIKTQKTGGPSVLTALKAALAIVVAGWILVLMTDDAQVPTARLVRPEKAQKAEKAETSPLAEPARRAERRRRANARPEAAAKNTPPTPAPTEAVVEDSRPPQAAPVLPPPPEFDPEWDESEILAGPDPDAKPPNPLIPPPMRVNPRRGTD